MKETELPGYEVIYKSPETRKPDWRDWLGALSNNLVFGENAPGGVGIPDGSREGQQKQRRRYLDILAHFEPGEIDPNPEELEQAPLFTLGDGFESEHQPKFDSGEIPAQAPLTKEQMRILLFKTVPKNVLPFVMEKLEFNYEASPDGISKPPEVSIVSDKKTGKPVKAKITFHRDNFITRGQPPQRGERVDSQYIWGFVDSSKIMLFMGKLIARLIDEPREIEDKAGHKYAKDEIFSPHFYVTTETRRAIEELVKKGDRASTDVKQQVWARQWEDFVGLSMTLPEVAKAKYPHAYEYLQDELKSFADPEKDAEKLKQLEANKDFHNFSTAIDLRTDDEKAEALPISPQTDFFDRTIAGLNKGLSLFGWQMSYVKLGDPEREKLLAKDNDEVMRLVENYDYETRMHKFGEVLEDYPDNDIMGRSQGRRLLLSFAKEGELTEWPVYAWLNKFSPTFRSSVPIGQEISSEDYRDIKMIYKLAEKEGKMLGFGTLPYDAEMPNEKEFPDAKHYGTPIYYYRRRSRKKYLDDIRKKLSGQSGKAVYETNSKVFDQFWSNGQAVDLDKLVTREDLLAYVPMSQVDSIANLMDQMDITKVSAPVRALAEAWNHHYMLENGKPNEHMNDKGLDVIRHYKDQLSRVQPVDPSELLRKSVNDMTPEEIEKVHQAIDPRRKAIIRSIDERMTRAGLDPDIITETNKVLLEASEKLQPINAEDLTDALDDYIKVRYAGDANKMAIKKRELQIFFLSNHLPKDLEELSRLIEIDTRLDPRYVKTIESAVGSIDKLAAYIVKDSLNDSRYKQFVDLGFGLTDAEDKVFDDTLREPFMIGATDPKIDTPLASVERSKFRAREVQKKIKEADPSAKAMLVVSLITNGINELNPIIEKEVRKGKSYTHAYKNSFLLKHKIFATKQLSTINSRLATNMQEMDVVGRRDDAIIELNRTIEDLNKALAVVQQKHEKKAKP